jgi:glycosyltransferase involved in cell wall biosynthesis
MTEFAKEPLLSFIVPIYDLDPDILKRCLLSLEDQDYPNIEVVCVLDGPNVQLVNIVCDFLSRNKGWKVLEIEHGGACAARNAGFNISTGEIVSFFNSDYIANPGMARMWVTQLQAHPDCGFVYGAYEYLSSRRWAYPSKPFDPWQLKIANYIDCGFPLWRKYVVEWDVNCKSLQDWDFWLRVVKGKTCKERHLSNIHAPLCVGECRSPVQGHFLGRDISFAAEPPRPKGLSEDSSQNWIDRVHYIKEKNGIAEPDICVTSLGARNHATEIAKLLGADFRDDTIFKPHAYKALYMIGWYMKPGDTQNDHPAILMNFDRPGCKKIVHFAGADVFWLRKFSYESLQMMLGALRMKADHILCEADFVQKELKALGLDSEIVPIPSYSDWKLRPLPKEFSVAIFLTDHNDFDKYCFDPTLSIVRAMPDVQFKAYGDRAKDLGYPNLKHCGNLSRKEWEEFVYDNSAILRLVRHDTLPLSCSEFIMAGRQAITNIPQKYATYINTQGNMPINEWDIFGPGLGAERWPETKKKIIQEIRRIKKNPAQSLEARECYLDLMDKEKYRKKIRELAEGGPNANVEQQATSVVCH